MLCCVSFCSKPVDVLGGILVCSAVLCLVVLLTSRCSRWHCSTRGRCQWQSVLLCFDSAVCFVSLLFFPMDIIRRITDSVLLRQLLSSVAVYSIVFCSAVQFVHFKLFFFFLFFIFCYTPVNHRRHNVKKTICAWVDTGRRQFQFSSLSNVYKEQQLRSRSRL